ncbi:hypothetical protein [Actinomycetospora cinnamomea]|uniref:Uncharacterized protein n=1 Tax=Actinomycetospora cinnamomea TaxID=663609 RepID=A0A2U1F709_9PSEU|nr:hypothetical protein [Actinomycetospora cinnamomea]PVZ07987.1 hypothetical protein C8D89_110141 [Actinomycetospora cinnamomea]
MPRRRPATSRTPRWVAGLVVLLVTAAGCSSDGASGGGTRDVYAWPFSWDSVWNLPLSTEAQYRPFDTRAEDLELDWNNITVDPRAPVRTLRGDDEGVPVHVDPGLSADGEWNNCSALLVESPDRKTVIQGQPMELEPGGDPSWEYGWSPLSLTGPGTEGCHGGSGLSGLGGTIRRGELTAPGPIRHALKLGLNCTESCSREGDGYRWPAVKADRGYEDKYGGSDPDVHMGTLFAVAPDTDLSWITQPDVRKVAEALRDYGGYVVDETANDKNFVVVERGAEPEMPNIHSGEMRRLFASLSIVTNSARETPGGGPLDGPRRVACAPPFADGTGGAPPTCGPSDA